VVVDDPGDVTLCRELREVPDGHPGQVCRTAERDPASRELVERPVATPLVESFGEERPDGGTPVELLCLEIRLEFGLQFVGDADRDGTYSVYVMYNA
jgi:hypothetical protein